MCQETHITTLTFTQTHTATHTHFTYSAVCPVLHPVFQSEASISINTARQANAQNTDGGDKQKRAGGGRWNNSVGIWCFSPSPPANVTGCSSSAKSPLEGDRADDLSCRTAQLTAADAVSDTEGIFGVKIEI